jgi:hypothetical protein
MQGLYRYIFRGSKVLFAVGTITILALAIASQMRRSAERRSPDRPPDYAKRPGRHSHK